MVIKAVILDFGGTLAEGYMEWNEFHVNIKNLLIDLGYDIKFRNLKRAISAALEKLNKIRKNGNEMTFEEVYSLVLLKLGVSPKAETLLMIHDMFKDSYKETLYPCVEDVLRRLSKSYKIALISNTISDKPRLTLKKLNLIKYFDVVVCSRDLGMRKPNPKIFEYVLNKLGVLPNEAVHVGDDVEADMEGSLKAGLTPIWIKNPNSSIWYGHSISNICELPGFLGRLNSND